MLTASQIRKDYPSLPSSCRATFQAEIPIRSHRIEVTRIASGSYNRYYGRAVRAVGNPAKATPLSLVEFGHLARVAAGVEPTRQTHHLASMLVNAR
jgi:hypothetical protein